MSKILLIEDENILAESIADALEVEGHETKIVNTISSAKQYLENHSSNLILLDLALPDGSGLDFLDFLTNHPQAPTVIVLTANSSVSTVVQAIRRGAYDYLAKPFELDVLLHRIENAISHREGVAAKTLQLRLNELEKQSKPLVAPLSKQMKELYEHIKRIAVFDSMTVLIIGETGVGKEHICKLLHELSPRSKEPFIAVNCATLDKSLLQSELFGHEKGAFTGATERRKGLFECANRGTLFLDEVSEMPMDIQASFLRVLESRHFRRLGGSLEIETNARILAATNQDLNSLVHKNKFREDLFFRLNQIEIHIPPLRTRPEDIRILAEHFCNTLSRSLGITISLTEDAFDCLMQYSWPGNIRELKNVIERTVIIKGTGQISGQDFALNNSSINLGFNRSEVVSRANTNNYKFMSLSEMEASHIEKALNICSGNRTQAAKLLGIARSSLIRKLEELAKPNKTTK